MRAAFLAALALVVCPLTAAAQQHPILEIRINRLPGIVIEAEGTYLAPLLPVQTVRELAGLPPGDPGYVTIDQLSAILDLTVDYSPAHALVQINDPIGQLPVLVAARRQAEVDARFQQPNNFGGPYAFAEANAEGSYKVGAGVAASRYSASLQHSLSGQAYGSARRETRWRTQLAPFRSLWLSYRDSDQRPARFEARASYHSGFATLGYTVGARSPTASVAGGIGRVSAIVETTDFTEAEKYGAAITYTGRVTITVGYNESTFVGRVAVGAYHPSPFTIPNLQ